MPTSVIGNVKDMLGVSNPSGVSVRLSLKWEGTGTPRVNGAALILSTAASGAERVVSDMAINAATGAITGSVYSTRDATGNGNGEIEINGSLVACYYELQISKSGGPTFRLPVHAKNGATLDLTNVTPITTDPIIAAPTGDTTYARLDGGNQPFTAPVQAPSGILKGSLTLEKSDGTLPATIANDTAGGVNVTTNGGKTWEFANSGSLSSPLGAPVQFNGASSGLVNVAAPAAAGANNLTLPALTGIIATINNAQTWSGTQTNMPLANPTIDQINQKAATVFTIADNTAGTRFQIPSNGTSPTVINNAAIAGASTLGGTAASSPLTPFNRLAATRGTTLIAAKVGTLTGWGTTASVGAVFGTDSCMIVNIQSAGTGQTTNPTFVVTFSDGTWTNAPTAIVCRADGNAPSAAAYFNSSTATTVTIGLQGTPAAGTLYGFIILVIGR